MHKCSRLLAAGLLLLPLTAFAESTPEATAWLERVARIYEKAPLTADFEMRLSPAPDMPVAGAATGRLIQKDQLRMRAEMDFEMGGAEGQPGMKMSLLTVNDGTTLWNEVDMGMGKQVTKLAVADARKMAGQSALGVGMSGGGMDPVAQVAQLAKLLDFQVVDTANGKVTLRAEFDEETLRKMAGSAAMPGFETLTLVLDEKNAFPLMMEIGGEQPFITMSFSNVEFVDASKLPAKAFEYTPPEGVPVIDAAAMAGAQGDG